MTRGKKFILGLCSLAVPILGAGFAQADHIRIQFVPTVNAPVMVQRPPVVVPETLQVDGITANQVRARKIYANRIAADHVQGAIYQTGGIEALHAHGEINASAVTAAVIYADTIDANLVAADELYVRDLLVR